MTSLRLGIYRPGADGVALPAVGHVLLTPHARRTTAPAEPTDVVVPDRVAVELADGRTADPVVALAPGYWAVWEQVRAGATYLVLVPGSSSGTRPVPHSGGVIPTAQIPRQALADGSLGHKNREYARVVT